MHSLQTLTRGRRLRRDSLRWSLGSEERRAHQIALLCSSAGSIALQLVFQHAVGALYLGFSFLTHEVLSSGAGKIFVKQNLRVLVITSTSNL